MGPIGYVSGQDAKAPLPSRPTCLCGAGATGRSTHGAAHALAGLLGLGGGGAGALAAMAQLAHSQIHDRREGGRTDRETDRPESSYQMSVPNELIGSVIGQWSDWYPIP